MIGHQKNKQRLQLYNIDIYRFLILKALSTLSNPEMGIMNERDLLKLALVKLLLRRCSSEHEQW